MDYIHNGKSINEFLEKHLSEKRLRHVYNVVLEAEKLSNMYHANVEKAKLAALFHDMAKGFDNDEMNTFVKKFNLDEKYLNNRNIAHGKVAAMLMKTQWGIDDEEVIDAVSYHTTGRVGMSKTEKIVFIADAIEPGRDYDGIEILRNTTYEDLDKGCLLSLTNTVNHLKEIGVVNIDEDTLKAQKWFKDQIDKKRKEQ